MPKQANHSNPQLGPNRDSDVSRIIHTWFDEKGQSRIVDEDRSKLAPYDYIAFLRESGLLTKTLGLTQRNEAGWDVDRIFDASEALAFHGFVQWLMWHVSSLGVLPVWMSGTQDMRSRYEKWLEAGLPAAFAMSEKVAGADWRKTATKLTVDDETCLRLTGEKNYAGNAQFSPMVSTFVVDKTSQEQGYAFIRTSAGQVGYQVRKNAVPEQMYVCDFTLDRVEIRRNEIISQGQQAFFDAVNSINIGKVNLATAALGLHSRMLLETVAHLDRRTIFGRQTSEFGQNSEIISRAIARQIAMRSFLMGCRKAMKAASARDESYIVLNSTAKVLVTDSLERSINELTDAASAFSFESDSPIYALRNYISYLPRLEGTKYVNIAQTLKSMKAYFSTLFSETEDRTPSSAEEPTGREYLLSPRRLGGFRTHLRAPLLTQLQEQEPAKSIRVLLTTLEYIAEWVNDSDLEFPLDDEASNQAVGEIYGWVVIAATILGNERDATLLDSHMRVIADELLQVLGRYRSRLTALGFPVPKCTALLLGVDNTPVIGLNAAREAIHNHRASMWTPKEFD